MGKNVKVDFKELQQFQKKFEQVGRSVQEDFVEKCAKELAARLLRKVIKRTPVGVYGGHVEFITKKGERVSFEAKKHKTGGTLKRGWTKDKSVKMVRTGSFVRIDVTNVEERYASYVEYGHRTPGGKGWVKGHLMMTISAREIRSIAPALLQKRLEEKLREAFR